MEEEAVLDVGIKYPGMVWDVQMTGGTRGKRFFAGAVGGLALALLLVGVTSYLPQTNNGIQSALAPSQSLLVAAQSTATTTASAPVAQAGVTATTSTSAGRATALSSNGTSAFVAVSQGANSSTSIPGQAGGVEAGGAVSSAALAFASATSGTQPRPSSMLAVLPGEGLGTIIATISPLVVALLVAGLIYGAYTRRQDAAS